MVVVVAEQASVDALDGWAGRDPELVAEQEAQAVVDAQRLCDVPTLRECLHQDQVAGLAERGQLDQADARNPRPAAESGPPSPSLASAKHSSPRDRTSSRRRRHSFNQGRSWPWSRGLLRDVVGEPGGAPRFRPLAGQLHATRPGVAPRAPASTSTNAPAGSTSSSWARPVSSSGAMTRRSFESSTLSRGWWPAVASSP